MEYARLDRFYVDVGKEICALEGSLCFADSSYETEPQVYS
jgi:hypothetical protein